MKDLFPYIGETIIVTQEMCDFNGHMNVNFIKKVFEQGWDFVNKDFGFNEDYLNQGFSSFTLEDNYRFKKEFLLGDKIFPVSSCGFIDHRDVKIFKFCPFFVMPLI